MEIRMDWARLNITRGHRKSRNITSPARGARYARGTKTHRSPPATPLTHHRAGPHRREGWEGTGPIPDPSIDDSARSLPDGTTGDRAEQAGRHSLALSCSLWLALWWRGLHGFSSLTLQNRPLLWDSLQYSIIATAPHSLTGGFWSGWFLSGGWNENLWSAAEVELELV
nr:uncharacterized protein LOC112279991 isoform X2 [Physcomitrium patens]|eukprot:XP_024370631.1 uncharacterized protein LOC112279991 isoform X2 [Physcomitrella patens]